MFASTAAVSLATKDPDLLKMLKGGDMPVSGFECWDTVGILYLEMGAQYGVHIYIRLSVAMSVIFVVLSCSSFRLSVVMSVVFVMSSYSSFHLRMHPVTFVGVLCVDMSFVLKSHITQRQHRLMIFGLSGKFSLLMRIV